MVVDRFCDRTSIPEPLHVRFKLHKVVRIRVERGDVKPLSLLPVVPVVIVKGDGRDQVRAEDLADGVRERRLPGPAVTGDTDHKDQRRPADDLLEVGNTRHANGTCDAIGLKGAGGKVSDQGRHPVMLEIYNKKHL